MIRVVKELIGFTLVAMIVLLLAAGTKLWVNADSAASVSGNSASTASVSTSQTNQNSQGNLKVGAIPQTTLDGVYATNRVTAVSVTTSIDRLRTILLTPAEIAAGDRLSIYVCNNKNRQLEEYITANAAYYPGETAAECFQVDLYKTNTNGNVTAIRESSEPITITIGIPAHLRKENRQFRIFTVRQSTGAITAFSDVDLSDTSLTIGADAFGTYVLTYTDIATPISGAMTAEAASSTDTNASDPADLFAHQDKTTFQGCRIADKYVWEDDSDRLVSFYIVLDNNDIRTIYHQMYYYANSSDAASSYLKDANIMYAIQSGNANLVSQYGYNAILDFYTDPQTGEVTHRWYKGDGDWNLAGESSSRYSSMDESATPSPEPTPSQTITVAVAGSGGRTITLLADNYVYRTETGAKFHLQDDCGNINSERTERITVRDAVENYHLEACELCYFAN